MGGGLEFHLDGTWNFAGAIMESSGTYTLIKDEVNIGENYYLPDSFKIRHDLKDSLTPYYLESLGRPGDSIKKTYRVIIPTFEPQDVITQGIPVKIMRTDYGIGPRTVLYSKPDRDSIIIKYENRMYQKSILYPLIITPTYVSSYNSRYGDFFQNASNNAYAKPIGYTLIKDEKWYLFNAVDYSTAYDDYSIAIHNRSDLYVENRFSFAWAPESSLCRVGVIENYYYHIKQKKYNDAYELWHKEADLEHFISIYKGVTDIKIYEYVEESENKFKLIVSLKSDGVWSVYKVSMTVRLSGILDSSSEEISQFNYL